MLEEFERFLKAQGSSIGVQYPYGLKQMGKWSVRLILCSIVYRLQTSKGTIDVLSYLLGYLLTGQPQGPHHSLSCLVGRRGPDCQSSEKRNC